MPDSTTNAFLADLKTAAYSAWIGGYKDLENNIWGLWTDGTPWSYTNWGPGQPSDTLGEEDFLVMQGTGTIWTNGQWNDGLDTAYPQRSLCQYNPKGDKFLTFYPLQDYSKTKQESLKVANTRGDEAIWLDEA